VIDLGASMILPIPHGAVSVDLRVTADVAVAAVVARRVAWRAGFDAISAAEVATVAAELAANVVRHGGGGEIYAWVSDDVVHLLAGDRGRGRCADWNERVLGAATADAAHGLGAVRRLMDAVEFAERPGGGLQVLASRRRRKIWGR
jgi:anti-sigma regulatory factor (Ser/Thr protein kinase)